MDSRLVAGAGLGALVLGLSGCSSPPPSPPPAGSLPSGTAEVTIDGGEVNKTTAVSCSTEGAITAIVTGGDDSGTTSTVDTSEGLTVQSAQIRNVGGFTGSYLAQLDPKAESEMKVIGRTFVVSGTANGLDVDNASFRTAGAFSIRVAC